MDKALSATPTPVKLLIMLKVISPLVNAPPAMLTATPLVAILMDMDPSAMLTDLLAMATVKSLMAMLTAMLMDMDPSAMLIDTALVAMLMDKDPSAMLMDTALVVMLMDKDLMAMLKDMDLLAMLTDTALVAMLMDTDLSAMLMDSALVAMLKVKAPLAMLMDMDLLAMLIHMNLMPMLKDTNSLVEEALDTVHSKVQALALQRTEPTTAHLLLPLISLLLVAIPMGIHLALPLALTYPS